MYLLLQAAPSALVSLTNGRLCYAHLSKGVSDSEPSLWSSPGSYSTDTATETDKARTYMDTEISD